MIGVCDIKGFVPEACEVIQIDGEAEGNGTFDGERFEEWLEDKLLPRLGRYAFGEPRSVVVMDNASIHHSDRVVELIESVGSIVLYLPPYSPDKNPIEFMFATYKAKLKKLGRDHNWLYCHYRALDAVSPDMARNCFRHCGIPLMKPDDDDRDFTRRIILVTIIIIYIYQFHALQAH